jgi:CheY-like chemotaxis protein
MIRILLADDDTDDTELFCEAVAEVDPDVQCDAVFDGSEVLAKLNDHEYPRPDMIVLDINMPDVNGWETLKAIRAGERYAELPVFIYSTSSVERDKQIAKDLEASGFFTKPERFEEVKALVKILIDRCRQGNL